MYRTYLGIAACGALLFALGVGVGTWLSTFQTDVPGVMSREGGYRFINPLLACDISEDTQYAGYDMLKESLDRAVAAELASGAAGRVSVYVRSMNNGRWIGVHQDDLFAPASLMKVPLLVAFLKQNEDVPGSLTRPLTLSEENYDTQEHVPPLHPLVPGRTYAIQELLRAMIQESDNNASRALEQVVPNARLADVYGDFGIPPSGTPDTNSMSAKAYMRVFRILYNASYLNKENSQRALELLAETQFHKGLVAGVPESTTVTHKFGERTIFSGTTRVSTQLHDCGIVYYPRLPYGICVMTEGSDIESLQGVVARISQAVYTAVNDGALAH